MVLVDNNRKEKNESGEIFFLAPEDVFFEVIIKLLTFFETNYVIVYRFFVLFNEPFDLNYIKII